MDSASNVIQIISKINPLSYGVNGVRALLSGSTSFVFSNLLVLLVITAIMLIIGSKLFSRMKV